MGEREPLSHHPHALWAGVLQGRAPGAVKMVVFIIQLYLKTSQFTVGNKPSPTKSICSSRNTAGRTVPAFESVHFISLMCMLYCKKCQSADFENAVVAVAVEPVVSGYGRMGSDWCLMAALILGSLVETVSWWLKNWEE